MKTLLKRLQSAVTGIFVGRSPAPDYFLRELEEMGLGTSECDTWIANAHLDRRYRGEYAGQARW